MKFRNFLGVITLFIGLLLVGGCSLAPNQNLGGGLWYPSGGNLRPVNSSWGVKIPALTNCDTIDTDANGVFSCGVDAVGAGGSGLWASTTDDQAIRPIDNNYAVIIGANATSTMDTQLEIHGGSVTINDGKLAIGTSTLNRMLTIDSGTTNNAVKLVSTDAGVFIEFWDNTTTNASLIGGVGDELKLYGGGTLGLTVNSSGNIQVNTITSGTWQGSEIQDAYIADDITASNYVRKTAWTDHDNYPAGCSAGYYVQAIGDTLTCAADQDTTYTAGSHLTLTGTQFDVDDDFLLNTGDTGTGVYDFGGATSFEIPNGTAPTTDAAGEIAVDTTSGQIQYHDGTAERAIDSRHSICVTIVSSSPLLSGDQYRIIVGGFPYGITVYKQAGQVDNGTSLVFTLTDGTNDMDSITAGTTLTTQNPTTNNTFNADEQIILKLGTNTGNVNQASYCAYYRINAD